MKSGLGTTWVSGVVLLTAGAVLLAARGGDDLLAADAVAIGDLRDEPLSTGRAKLLDLAFDCASSIPVEPHVKTRCRTQDEVVATCLELDQPARALRYLGQIVNWRRGTGYADLAFYLVQRGDTDRAAGLLVLAREVAEEQDRIEHTQAWRKDRIRAKIARVHMWAGRDGEAEEAATGLVPSEAAVVAVARAENTEASELADRMAALETLASTGSFDQVHGALQACARLFDRFYETVESRQRAEEAIRRHSKSLPLQIQVELRMDLARVALSHEDPAEALRLVGEGRELMRSAAWLPEHGVPLQARLGALRFAAGEREEGRHEVEEAKALYEARREEIVDVFRAGALRPLAESYFAMDDRGTAAEVYRAAVEEGARNPNARPRAEDLAATCCSMAVHGFEPDEALRARLAMIREGLVSPW